ncbi:MAG: hypothetical protein Q7P63_04605 [Verrucomicrobiota bacterium JB022]|nr:hypothetical protein [Verrucomicrobiota bacterium JB022]
MQNPTPTIDPIILAALQGVRTIGELQEVWLAFASDLQGYTYLFACDEKSGRMHWPARQDFEGKAYLRSPFGRNSLFFVSNEILYRLANYQEVYIPVNYSIGFDSNVASYLRQLIFGKNQGDVTLKFRKVLADFCLRRFNWDTLPYLLENAHMLKEGKNLSEIWETILAEFLFSELNQEIFAKSQRIEFLDSDQATAIARAQDQLQHFDRALKAGLHDQVESQVNIFELIVLKIALLKRRSPSTSQAARNTADLVEWMDSVLGAIVGVPLWAGVQYFLKSGAFKPLSKLGSSGERAYCCSRNLAWDIYHVYSRQQQCMTGSNGEIIVPYMLTYDKGLADLFDGFPYVGCLVHVEYDFPLFINDPNILNAINAYFPENKRITNMTDQYFNPEAMQRRRSRNHVFSPSDCARLLIEYKSTMAS